MSDVRWNRAMRRLEERVGQSWRPIDLPQSQQSEARTRTIAASYSGVPTSRTIATTAPLTGGGDLSADRTLAMPAFGGAAVPGYVPDPTSETGKFLKDDGTWAAPSGGSGNATSTGAYGSEPGSPTTGDLYLPDSDGTTVERYNGTDWTTQQWGPIEKVTPPRLASFSTIDPTGSGTFVDNVDGIVVTAEAVTGQKARLCYQAAPSSGSDWQVTMRGRCLVGAGAGNGGLLVREAGGKFVASAWHSAGYLYALRFTSPTVYSAAPVSHGVWGTAQPEWLRITWTAATGYLDHYYSLHPSMGWTLLHSHHYTAFLGATPSDIGFYCNSVNATTPATIWCQSWAVA